jgi:hypothetical protein
MACGREDSKGERGDGGVFTRTTVEDIDAMQLYSLMYRDQSFGCRTSLKCDIQTSELKCR